MKTFFTKRAKKFETFRHVPWDSMAPLIFAWYFLPCYFFFISINGVGFFFNRYSNTFRMGEFLDRFLMFLFYVIFIEKLLNNKKYIKIKIKGTRSEIRHWKNQQADCLSFLFILLGCWVVVVVERENVYLWLNKRLHGNCHDQVKEPSVFCLLPHRTFNLWSKTLFDSSLHYRTYIGTIFFCSFSNSWISLCRLL